MFYYIIFISKIYLYSNRIHLSLGLNWFGELNIFVDKTRLILRLRFNRLIAKKGGNFDLC